MTKDMLYLIKHECEDDPYCAHWYETDLMTHDKDKAYSKLKAMCGEKPFDEITDYNGFAEEYEYDQNRAEYVFVRRINASPSQIRSSDLAYSSDVDEKILALMNGQIESCAFKRKLRVYVFDDVISREFDVRLERLNEYAGENGKFKFTLITGHDQFSGRMDCSENWWQPDPGQGASADDMNKLITSRVKWYCVEKDGKFCKEFHAWLNSLMAEYEKKHATP